MLRLLRKSAVYTVDQLAGMVGWFGYQTSSGEPVTSTRSVEVTAVMCAARVIAEGLAQVPIRVIRENYDDDGQVRRKIDRQHWAHKLLAEKPNGWQTPFEFREYAVLSAVLDGAFLGIKNTFNGEVREIMPVPMGAWSVTQNPDYSLSYQVTYADRTHGVFSADQVFLLRGPSIDSYSGLSAVRAAREAIGLSVALEKQQAKLAGNGGKPPGIISFKEPLSPEAKEKLRSAWQQKYGPNGDGGVAILDGDAKFAPMSMTSVDAQYLETRRHQIEEIARAFRVHPTMLMHSNATTTFASVEQHFRNHVIHTLGPWMRRFEDVCARDVLRGEADLRVDLDERGLLRGDFADQAEYYTKALGSGGQPGWMTVDEVRAERDMNPIDEDWTKTVPRGAMQPRENDSGD